jgi:hypothetical protein
MREVNLEKDVKCYRTHAYLDSADAILELKEKQDKMKVSLCLLNKNQHSGVFEYLIAELMSLFS